MLENSDAVTSAADDLPRPPAGRRAKSRPAGPPQPVTAPPVVAAPAAAAESTTQDASVPETPAAAVPVATETVAPAATPAVEAPTPEAGPSDAAAPNAAAAQSSEPAPSGENTAEQPAQRAPRRRSPRKSAEAAGDDAPQRPARRRSRKAAVDEQPRESDAATVDTPTEPEPAEASQAPSVAEPAVAADAAATQVARDDVDAAAAADPDGEAASDDLDTEIARRLPAAVANPFTPPVVRSPRETEDALASLAQAIASDDDADEDDADAEDESGEHDEESRDEGTRPRRRRRGGRRRRRSSDREDRDDNDADDADGAQDHAAGSENAHDDADNADGSDNADNEASSERDHEAEDSNESGRRRRRRRRRRGESTDGDDDPNVEVVSRVREPRRSHASDEVTGIEGSTRMEAKRQRRREGRSAGRRRAPILSEAEFLSRRESVKRTMVIRQKDEYTQLGVLEDNVLVEHYVDRKSSTSLIGNIYLGRVQNVLPSMEAAFIDIGRGRNAVLYAGEVDWAAHNAEGSGRKMEAVFKSGQSVLVQVTKDPVGAKGARLTNHISLPGRYIVYSPGGELSGISRKLPDTERARLKGLLDDLIPDEASVIVRTAAEGVAEEDLVRDVNRLKAQWEAIEKKSKAGHAPQQLYAEPDATVRIVRDLFTEDFGELIVDGNGGPEDAYDMIEAYVTHVAPHLGDRLQRWDREKNGDLFSKYRIDEQIAKALERKVFLPSGGSLIIDRTEAMTVIDVNTGKFTGSGGNLEATVTSNNLEAAEEIVRQLRLRDIGGIIVVDFIDMVLPSNRELLLRRLVECLGRDRTRHQVAEVTSLGLVQMTRKKIGTGLAEAFTEPCDECKGRGYIRSEEPVESQAPADGGERHANKGRPPRNRGGRKGDAKSHDKHEKGAKAEKAHKAESTEREDAAAEPPQHEAPAEVEAASHAQAES